MGLFFLVPTAAQAPKHLLDEADKTLGHAWMKRDLDTVMTLFADDAQSIWPGKHLRGKAAIRSFVEALWKDSNYTPISGKRDVYEVSTSGDLAVMHGISSHQWTGKLGPVVASGTWVAVWRKTNGKWQIILDGFTQLEETPVTPKARATRPPEK